MASKLQNVLAVIASFILSGIAIDIDPNGYIMFCPCMGEELSWVLRDYVSLKYIIAF